MNEKEIEIIIHIDSREKNENIKHLFDDCEFSTVITKLERGDIHFGDVIGIERKSVSDLISSVQSSSFFEKLFDMRNHFKYTYLWVDGTDYEWRKNLSYRHRSAFASLQGIEIALDKIGVIYKEKTKEEASEYFLKVFRDIVIKKEFVPRSNIKKKGKSLTELKLQTLQSIPKIGYKSALSLLKEYKYLGVIVNKSKNSDDKKLKEIKRIFWK